MAPEARRDETRRYRDHVFVLGWERSPEKRHGKSHPPLMHNPVRLAHGPDTCTPTAFTIPNGPLGTGSLQCKKGDEIATFLEKCRQQFPELRGVSADNLMYVKVRGSCLMF